MRRAGFVGLFNISEMEKKLGSASSVDFSRDPEEFRHESLTKAYVGLDSSTFLKQKKMGRALSVEFSGNPEEWRH